MHFRVTRKSTSIVNMNSWINLPPDSKTLMSFIRQILGKEKKVSFNELHLDYRLCWIETNKALRSQNTRSCL